MQLNDVAYVPSFSKNLVSGIQIMNQGYKQIIENGGLKIFKNNDLVATGKYDLETGLIKIVEECSYSANYINLQSFVLPLLKKIDSDFDPSEKEIGGVAFSDCPWPGVSFSDCP